MDNKLRLVLFLSYLLAICKAGVVSRHKFRSNDIFSMEVELSTVKNVEKDPLPRSSTFEANETNMSKNSNVIKSSVFTPINESELNTSKNYSSSIIAPSISSNEPDNEDMFANMAEKRNWTQNETSPNIKNAPSNSSNSKFSNGNQSSAKGIDVLEIVAHNWTRSNNSTKQSDDLKFHSNGSNIMEPILEEMKVNQSLTSATPQFFSNSDQGMEFSGDISDNESTQVLGNEFSTNTLDANITEVVEPSSSFEFLMNFDVAKNAAMAMEIFNLTDSSLTDHIIEENEFHGLLDLMLPTIDDKNSNSTDISTRLHNTSEELVVNLTEVVEQGNQSLQVNLNEVMEFGNQMLRDNLTEIIKEGNQTLSTDLTEVVEAGNQTLRVNLTEVVEAGNQTLRVNLTEVVEEGNKTTQINLTEVVEEGNKTTQINLTEVVEEGNKTIQVNFTEVGNKTSMELNLHESMNHTSATFNDSKVENQTTIAVSEMEVNNTITLPKCPPPGICIFWFFAQDTCAVNDHCLGSRICCRIRCSKTCIEV